MSAIAFDDILKLMKELNTPYIRVLNVQGKKIMDFDDSMNVDHTIEKLKNYQSALNPYGRVDIIAADEKIKTAKWQGAYHWSALLTGAAHSPTHTPHMHGYMSEREVSLTNQLHRLEMQIEFDKKVREMEERMSGKDEGFKIGDLLNALPLFMDIPAHKMQAFNAMRGMSGNQTQGIAGPETKSNLSVQMTEDETTELQKRFDALSQKVQMLISHKDVGIDKLEKVIDAAIANPSMVDTLLSFIK